MFSLCKVTAIALECYSIQRRKHVQDPSLSSQAGSFNKMCAASEQEAQIGDPQIGVVSLRFTNSKAPVVK